MPADEIDRPRWVVDGMNVIGSRPDGWWRDRDGAMERLVRRLDDFASVEGDDVTVVLDARPRRPLAPKAVKVLFASRRGPNAADDRIASLVEEDEDPATLRVVTSDSGLAARVAPRGAEVVPAGAFRRRLDGLAERRGGR